MRQLISAPGTMLVSTVDIPDPSQDMSCMEMLLGVTASIHVAQSGTTQTLGLNQQPSISRFIRSTPAVHAGVCSRARPWRAARAAS